MLIAGIDIDALAAWMDERELGAGPIDDVVSLVGGTQNILLRFERDGRDYVLRHPPIHARTNSSETMRREARILAALAGTAVPHPGLIASCSEETVLAGSFYLMEPVDGFNATSGLPRLHAESDAVQHRMGLALVEGIAALGALDYQALGLSDFGRPDNYLQRQVARWKTQLDGYTVMFSPDSGELAAIVDWELATIGDPLLDLGWLLATWPAEDGLNDAGSVRVEPWRGFPKADELVDHYADRSTRDLTTIGWYRVLACYKLGILMEGTYARACAGKAPRETGDLLHAKTVGLFERALSWID
jgi:aminoglycoside phosphotransferase (APT) family kinase protein